MTYISVFCCGIAEALCKMSKVWWYAQMSGYSGSVVSYHIMQRPLNHYILHALVYLYFVF